MPLRMPVIKQALCVHCISILLIIYGTTLNCSAHPDLSEQESMGLQNLNKILARLQRSLRETHQASTNENPDGLSNDKWAVIRSLRSSEIRAQDEEEKVYTGDNDQSSLVALRRHYRQTQGPLENFRACFIDFHTSLRAMISLLPQRLISGAPEVLLGILKIPNLMTPDDVSFLTKDTNKLVIKYRIIYEVIQVVKQKLGTYIKPEYLSWWQSKMDYLNYEAQITNFATASLPFDKSETISIMSGGISSVNISVQMGIAPEVVASVYSAAQFLAS